MTALTRRAFLQALGVSAAAAAVPWRLLNALPLAGHARPALQGRVLEPANLFNDAGHLVRRVFPDEIVSIRSVEPSWYGVAGGRLPRAAVQPVAALADWPAPAGSGLVTVAAAYAALRRWCAADAPLAARLGWGAAAEAVDELEMADGRWLGLRLPDISEPVWSPAAAWTTAGTKAQPGEAELVLDRAQRRLTVLQRGVVAWTSEAAIPLDLPAGRWPLVRRETVGRGAQPGAPWELDFGAWRLHGAYWHNRFAEATYHAPAGAVEVPVLAAQALPVVPVLSVVVL